jgi:hypothetical protein
MNISILQKKIIHESKRIIKNNYFFSNSLTYFPIFADTPGTLLLKSKIRKKFKLNFFINNLKFFFSILFTKVDFKKYFNDNYYFKNIYFSWGFKNNFDKAGNFKDKYINKNISDLKDTLIFLIYLDNELPKKVKPNIVLVYKKKLFKNFNFFFFVQYIIKSLGSNFFKKMSSFNFLSNQVIDYIDKNISLKNLKKVFIVYEGQPYQKNIIFYLKKKNKYINVTGYDHSAPPALPLNLVFDGCSPDRLLITGKEQASFYKKYLSWPRSKLKIIPSFRFKNEKKNFFQNKIFLPYELSGKNIFLNSFKILTNLNMIKNINNFRVKIHPLGQKLKEHIKFAESINQIIKNNQISQRNKNDNISIFFGQTTAIIVALELNFKCYHVCSYPIFDSYSPKLWNSLKVQQLSSNLFVYELIKKNSFIKKGHNNEKIF